MKQLHTDLSARGFISPLEYRNSYYGQPVFVASPRHWRKTQRVYQQRMPVVIAAFFPKRHLELEAIARPLPAAAWELEPMVSPERPVPSDGRRVATVEPIRRKMPPQFETPDTAPSQAIPDSAVPAAARHPSRQAVVPVSPVVRTEQRSTVRPPQGLVMWQPLGMKRIAWAIRAHILPALAELASPLLWQLRRWSTSIASGASAWVHGASPRLAAQRGTVFAFSAGFACCVVAFVFMGTASSTYVLRSPITRTVPAVRAAPAVAPARAVPLRSVVAAALAPVPAPALTSMASHPMVLPRPAAAVVAAPTQATPSPDRASPTPAALPTVTVVAPAPALLDAGKGVDLDIRSPDSVWYTTGERYGVDPLLLYAVALVETRALGTDGQVAPRPWVVRIDGDIVAGSRDDVRAAIANAQASDQQIQDVGIMQVYWPWHRDIAPDPIKLLSPAANIDAGARILRDAMQETSNSEMAVGYYHSHDRQKAQFYGRAVMTVYHRLQRVLDRAQPVDLASTSATGAPRQE